MRTFAILCSLTLALAGEARAALLFNSSAAWKYHKGRTEASTPDTSAWRSLAFNDSTWAVGNAPFYYGEPVTGTLLSDMQGSYSTVYLRRTFVITNVSEVSALTLETQTDDGHVVWINGVEVARFNVPGGQLAFGAIASGAIEPTTQTYTLSSLGMLVSGTNVIAVQALNSSFSGSTDFLITASLGTVAPDPVPPAVAVTVPPAGTISGLSQITVVFSEPVSGVNAADLLINGLPATSMTGGNDTYTFTFPQPPYGTVQISWANGHGIADFAVPPNPFNAAAPGASWQYQLVDSIPPLMTLQLPFSNVTVRALTQIEVVFSENVNGVNATDLLINGNPAAIVSVLSASNYVFQFPQPPPGPVQVAWAAGHGIQDTAAAPNPFAGGSWSYTLDPNAVLTAVRINELMAANVNGLRDEDNEAQDWVELFNTSTNAVSLAGWSLSDDPNEPEKWIFPPVAIGPRGYLIVFCSEKDRRPVTPGSRLHTNFKLAPEGEFLGLYNAEVPRALVSSFDPYPLQRRDFSYGYNSTDQLRYFTTPTPGAANPASTITDIVADPVFSHARGFYDASFSLTITCATPGVTIRYTLNGTAPTTSSGTVYSGPIAITGTTVIRALAYRTGLLPSDVAGNTYFFLEDVIRQSPNGQPPPGWPASWGGNVVDYGMDPDIVNSPTYAATIKDDLQAVPSISIVMNLEDLFNASTGIYANPGGDTIQWERPCSLELVHPEGGEGFQINCGIRIRGGFSRSTQNPKHAFRFFFRQEYGASKLNYPMFGPTGAAEFDKFDLRTMQNYSWSFQGDGNMNCLRDVMSRDIQLAMGQPATRGNFFHLYINGHYWGLYNSEERPESAFAESYVGGRAEDYDVVKVQDGYTTYATDGNLDAWFRLWQAATNGFANDADYFRVQGLNVDGTPNPAYENLLDVDNLIDYMLVILWGGNLDAPISNFLGNDSPNNWYGFRDRTGNHGGFRFVSHDAEHTLLDVNSDRTGFASGQISPDWTAGNPLTQIVNNVLTPSAAFSRSNPQYIWFRLQANAEFRMRVADRVQKWCFDGGPLTVESVRSMFLARSNEIQRAIVGESARWGDAKVATPFTRSTWVGAIMGVYNGFLGGRTAVLLNQLRADGLFPNLTAPRFSSPGGAVPAGFSLYLTNNNGSGTLYYTLDGADPRQRGGDPAPSALAYTPNTPIVLNFPAVVRARVRSGAVWSAIAEATFYTPQDFSALVASEIMYHAPDAGSVPGDDLEFLELKNVGTNTLDFSGIAFGEGINFTFPNGTRLAPGQFFVLGRNRARLEAKYPGLTVHGVYSGRLDNGGEQLTLVHALGTPAWSVDYKDSGRWPIAADGQGFSLVLRNPSGPANLDNPSSWRASTLPGGSPGADDPASTIPGIVINEVLTHTDPPDVDAIELHNPTAADVDIGGWFLTDDRTVPTKFRLPTGTMIGAGGFLVITEAAFNPTPGTNNSFSLDSRGEEVYLLSGDANTNLTGYSHGFNFGAAPNGVSIGRHVISTGDEHFVLQTATTLEAANAGPLVSPVVFRQIMYHPPDLPGDVDNHDDEYLEIRNRLATPVPLFDPAAPTNAWRLRGGVDFDFPPNLTLAPTQSLLLVSFDPADALKRAAFQAKYGSFGDALLYGPYTGKLDNSSDTLELQRPDVPDLDGVPYLVVDSVDYKDALPWPSSADGGGAALQRLNLAAYGDDPANWTGAAPLTVVAITPPSFAGRPGTNVTFTVAAYGTGTLMYQWRKDGVDLPGETNVSLTVEDVELGDDAVYTVRVSDLSGSTISQGANLWVLVTPVVVQAPLSQTVVAGSWVTFSTIISGNPPPFTYEWRSGTNVIASNISNERTAFFSFTVPAAPASQTYRVVIRNLATPASGVSHNPVATLTVLADTDQDGLPDIWENANQLNPTDALDAAIDSDGDTMSNGAEYIAGTDPLDETSYLKVEQLSAGGSASLSFPAVSNRTYSVLYTDGLTNAGWVKLADVVARRTNRMETVFDPSPVPQRYYRLATPRQP